MLNISFSWEANKFVILSQLFQTIKRLFKQLFLIAGDESVNKEYSHSTFVGVLRKKIRTHASFKKTITNYISVEMLIKQCSFQQRQK